ncbi:DUF4442 domain-containing protein [Psychrobacter submarinus]|uniref:DUF4442 domain-containing protein n=1 Tax=Psychrobacter submarinus TaxID=154108 RepID=UPI0019199CFC|nr:DUF4442 domain-containing protein [Psychrobacter submarinus]
MKLFPKNFEILNRKAKQYIMPILTPHLLKLRINTYAPYVGAGIKLEHLDTDQGLCVVSMGLTALNKNIVGTQFGGSLYAMTDPFYMLLLMQQLGSNYVVWDKSSHIEFVAPATSKVTARIKVSSSEATAIRKLAESGEPVFRDYRTEIVDNNQKVVAIVTKTVYIRLRKHSRSKSQASRLDLPDKPNDNVSNNVSDNVSGEASSEVSSGENN